MASDPGKRLSDLARRPSRELDMAEVERRGRRGRAVAFASRSLLVAAVIAVVATSLTSGPFGISPDLRPGEGSGATDDGAPPTRRGPQGEVFEKLDEQTQAEIFAFRALAATELMDLHAKRSYNWTYEEDTTRTPDGWRVGFAASDCLPRGNTFTCTGLSGEHPESGNALTDTFLIVALDEGKWTVVDVEGNMLPEERERIVGYSLPQEQESSHWDFASVSFWPEVEDALAISPIWVGAYPTSAPGSLCEVQLVDAEGDPVGNTRSFYQPPPARPFERGGWVRGGSVGFHKDAVDGRVNCQQYTGPGWEVVGGPELVGEPGEVSGVVGELIWRGERGFTMGAVCTATLEDADGVTVWEGSGRVEPLWRPGELRRYPYEADVFVSTRGESVDAERIGDFDCESR